MISFRFRVNKTFLDSQDHVITIPNEHTYKLRLEEAIPGTMKPGARSAVTLVVPDGRRFDGCVQFSDAGGKLFYQIRAAAEGTIPLRTIFLKEESIQVVMGKVDRMVQVYLLDAASQRQVADLLAKSDPQAEQRLIDELEKLTAVKRPKGLFL